MPAKQRAIARTISNYLNLHQVTFSTSTNGCHDLIILFCFQNSKLRNDSFISWFSHGKADHKFCSFYYFFLCNAGCSYPQLCKYPAGSYFEVLKSVAFLPFCIIWRLRYVDIKSNYAKHFTISHLHVRIYISFLP